MHAEIKKRWQEALRSGEYKQGAGSLRVDEQYCCLGVLCDLYSKEKNIPWIYDTFLESEYVLPLEVQQWAELDPDPTVRQSPISFYNDVNRDSFDEIANLIEEL